MFGDRGLVALAALVVFAMSAGHAAAADQTVDTPTGTYYVAVDGDATPPSYWVGDKCYTLSTMKFCHAWVGFNTGGAWADASVYEETNGCDGLQTGSGDCDGDGSDEPADTEVFAYEAPV